MVGFRYARSRRRGHRVTALGVVAALVAVGVFAASGTAVPFGSVGEAAATAVPASTSPPTINGVPVQDEYLTAGRGSWSGSPSEYEYQWQRCAGDGGACADIAGAIGRAYRAALDDLDRTLRVRVMARNADGTGSALSAATPVITAAAPVNVVLPSIAGAVRQGETLSASPGWWVSATPVTYSYQWVRCPARFEFSECAPIAGAGRGTYAPGAGDVGRTLFVQVKAQSAAGPTFVNSLPTAVVAPRGDVEPPSTTIAVSRVSLPNRLVISRVTFTPTRIARHGQPITMRALVTEAQTGKPVRGALVYAVGVPFDTLTPGREVQTGADGWATIGFTTRATFALTPENLVVLFVRARKSGASVLAGVSTRRLVSVRIG